MKILVACEESQEVTKAFRALGHEVYSSDIIPCSGGHPEWHIQGDATELLKEKWDMIIAFPPCTYLTNAAACRLYPQKGILNEERYKQGLEAKEFFMMFYNADCEKIIIENPVSSKIFKMPKHTQEIQPYEFGHPYTKKTRLWLKGVQNLEPTNVITENVVSWVNAGSKDSFGNRRKCMGVTHKSLDRSKTFSGIAQAMADQWGKKDTFIYKLYNSNVRSYKPNKSEETNMTEKTNTFEELDKSKAVSEEVAQVVHQPGDAVATNSGEVDIDNLSDVAVGDKVKYTRPTLDGSDDIVARFQVFKADTTIEPDVSQSGTSKYWRTNMILTYASTNEDGVENREYISGARQFVNKDGTASDISFWYEGAETQCAYLWELVAKALEIEPVELSPRQFVAFLNSKPKVAIKGMDYKNYNAAPGSPKTVQKNMPGSFSK